MRILLTNDDGIHAPGIHALHAALRECGHEVHVVAPLKENSGVSASLTLRGRLHVYDVEEDGLVGRAVDGTPADCVKLALTTLLRDAPDLVVAGLNNGGNLGTDVFYSGTVGAAVEACMFGLPAAAVSRGRPAEEPPAAPAPSSEEEEKEVRPLRTLTGQGKAYSLGLDGSEFTSDGVYEATVTVEVYSSLEAVFTIQVPFPLFQACTYTARFEDSEVPGTGYIFRYLRWDEAFADILLWKGTHNDYRLTDMSGTPLTTPFAITDTEDDRMGGTVSWRINLQGDPKFNFDRLDSLTLSCEVSCVP